METARTLRLASAGRPAIALAGGEKPTGEILTAAGAGITTVPVEQWVRAWMATAPYLSTGRRCVDMVYQRMLELPGHLRASGFGTCIVSGGGIEFVRACVRSPRRCTASRPSR